MATRKVKDLGNHGGANTNRRIVVTDGGFVYLAEKVDVIKRDGMIEHVGLTTCSVIRVWGTTAGLGEIALKGPTSNTVLDFCGYVEVPQVKLLALYACTYGE